MGRVAIANPQEVVPIDRAALRQVVRAVLDGEGVADAEISLAFVDNPTIHLLNKRYLDHDEPTDVLSFPLSEPNAKKLSGELVIGAEVALAQATKSRPRRSGGTGALRHSRAVTPLRPRRQETRVGEGHARARTALFARTGAAGYC